MKLTLTATLLLILSAAPSLRAEVAHIRIDRREPFADGHRFGVPGAYELLEGKLFFETDPKGDANARITDLERAPVNQAGKVESSADFFMLKPVQAERGNGCLLYDVHNRGNKLALWTFNEGERSNHPSDLIHAGNGFLLERGYSLLWTGWNGDVAADGTHRLLAGLPLARTPDGRTLSGRTWVEMSVDEPVKSSKFFMSPWGTPKAYPAVSLEQASANLTMRERRSDPPITVPRHAWSFGRFENGRVIPDPTSLYLEEGLRPGWLYDLTYTARDPRVSGLGLSGLRDAVSFFRYSGSDDNPLKQAIGRATIFGISQSGRLIHHFLYEGFNVDPSGRTIFDGAILHVPGAGKGLFNMRFAMATAYATHHRGRLYPSDSFPFSPVEQTDPVTGEKGNSLSRLRQAGALPKLFFVQTSTEYWERGASLLHTSLTGKEDLPLDPAMRLYLISGAGHLGAMPPERGTSRYQHNPLRHRGPVLRALLVAMDDWITNGVEPPPSRYPRIEDGTLVDLETFRSQFPGIPGVAAPKDYYRPVWLNPGPQWKTEGIAAIVPPEAGQAYAALLPAVDEDGNEIAGIRMPEVDTPLATYTGWNVRHEDFGAGGVLAGLHGSYFPFAEDAAERKRTGDPRQSIRERYPTRAEYLARYTESVLKLHRERFLLSEDVANLLAQAAQRNLPDPHPQN